VTVEKRGKVSSSEIGEKKTFVPKGGENINKVSRQEARRIYSLSGRGGKKKALSSGEGEQRAVSKEGTFRIEETEPGRFRQKREPDEPRVKKGEKDRQARLHQKREKRRNIWRRPGKGEERKPSSFFEEGVENPLFCPKKRRGQKGIWNFKKKLWVVWEEEGGKGKWSFIGRQKNEGGRKKPLCMKETIL